MASGEGATAGRSVPVLFVILLGMLSAGCFLFAETDINKRAGKAQIQNTESERDGVHIVLQKGHSDMIHAVVLSPNGRMVLTGSEDETARLWDVGSGQMVRSFVGFSIHGPHLLAFGSSGQVVIGDRQTVKVFEAATGRELRSLPVRDSERAMVSPDARVLATAGGTLATTIRLQDLTTGRDITQDPAGTPAIPLAFSSDGSRHLTQRRVAGVYGNLMIWDTASGKKVTTVDHSSEVRAAALSPDGRMVALQSTDRTLVVKEVETGRVLHQLPLALSAQTGRTTGFEFSRDNRFLATADSENLVRLWDLQSGRAAQTIRGTAVGFGGDGKTLVVGVMEGVPLLQNLDSGSDTKFTSGGTTGIVDVAMTADGKKALVAMEDGTVKLWDLTTGQILRSLAGPAESSIAISRIGGLIATAGGGDGSVSVWEFMTGRKLRTVNALKGNDADVLDRTVVSLRPDGGLLAVAMRDDLCVYDVASGKELHCQSIGGGFGDKLEPFLNPYNYALQVMKHSSENIRRKRWVRALTFSPDGHYLAVSTDTGVFLLVAKTGKHEREVAFGDWGGATKEEDEELQAAAGTSNVHNLAFNGDGEILVGVGPNWKGRWGDLHPGTMKSVGRFMLGTVVAPPGVATGTAGLDKGSGLKRELNYRGLALSLDGRVAAIGHGRLVKLWDSMNDRDLRNLVGHTANVTAVAMTPDDRFIVSGGQDGVLKVWEGATGREVASLMALGNEDYVAVTPDQYYRASNSRLRGVAFRVKGQIYPFEQFDLRLNRPDIVLKRLGRTSDDVIDSYRRAHERRVKKMGLTEAMLGADFHLPEVELLTNDVPVSVNAPSIALRVKATDSKYPLDRFNVFLNDVPVHGTAGLPLPSKQLQTHEQELQVPLIPGRNKIQISVLNQQGVESLKQTVYTTSTVKMAPQEIYVVGIGVSEYQDKAYNLRYAAKDAMDLIAIYRTVEQRQVAASTVHTLDLTNHKATKTEIIKAKDWLKQSKINDLVVVFAAGHGMTDERFDYYFGTHDIDPKHPATNGLPYEDFENLLDGIPALQKVLLLDTCFSGEIDKDQAIVVARADTGGTGAGTVKMRSFKAARGVSVVADDQTVAAPGDNGGNAPRLSNEMLRFQQDWFADLRRGTGAAVISSSSGNEYSLEGEQWKNGVFTYALLTGLQKYEADANKDQVVTVSELQAYVIDQVRKLTQGGQNPTVRRENLEYDFAVY
jgi:WD40 repeat protein